MAAAPATALAVHAGWVACIPWDCALRGPLAAHPRCRSRDPAPIQHRSKDQEKELCARSECVIEDQPMTRAKLRIRMRWFRGSAQTLHFARSSQSGDPPGNTILRPLLSPRRRSDMAMQQLQQQAVTSTCAKAEVAEAMTPRCSMCLLQPAAAAEHAGGHVCRLEIIS